MCVTAIPSSRKDPFERRAVGNLLHSSCYSETAPFQDGKQSQMHSHGFSSAIATTETSPGLRGYATCRSLVLADGLGGLLTLELTEFIRVP